MTTASTNTPPHIDAELSKLRLELKAWEQAFAAAHQGRKAARHDIKQCPEIGWEPSVSDGRNRALTRQKQRPKVPAIP